MCMNFLHLVELNTGCILRIRNDGQVYNGLDFGDSFTLKLDREY